RSMIRPPALEPWPELPLDAWKDTYATLHMWSQIIGKIRMKQCAPINHWWHVTLYLTSRGLTTGPMPYGDRCFQINFDFLSHELIISTGEGRRSAFTLCPCSVAQFYNEVMSALQSLDLPVQITTLPQEVP